MSDDSGTDVDALREFAVLVRPLAEAAEMGPEGIAFIANQAGIDLDDLLEDLDQLESITATLESTFETLETVIDDGFDGLDLDDVPEIASAVRDCTNAVDELRSLRFASDATIRPDDVADRLFEHLFVEYLEMQHSKIHTVLSMVGVVTVLDEERSGTAFAPERMDFDALLDLVDLSAADLAQLYGWATDEFDPYQLLVHLRSFLQENGVHASFELPSTEELAPFGVDVDTDAVGPYLHVPLFVVPTGDGLGTVGLRIVPLPADDPEDAGLVFEPYGAVADTQSFSLSEEWSFSVATSAGLEGSGFVIRPSGVDVVNLDDPSDALPSFHGTASLDRTVGGDEDYRRLLGIGATELAIGRLSAVASVDFDGTDFAFRFAIPVSGRLSVAPDDGDGFLDAVLPSDGIEYEFETTVGWSSDGGLFLENGGTLEASLPQHKSLGPVDISEIYLAALPDPDDDANGISLVGATSATVELGPVVGTVKRLGIEADVSFPEDADGNLGIVDLDLGFKPPEGIGLSVAAAAVSGGGYLEFEPEHERYSGTVQLHVGDLTLNAIGLLTTRLPDGGDGFSLLIVVSGEFAPVQLGLGVTLNGVGGLLGINRSVKTGPLGDAVRTGSLDTVLFPSDPVANAQQLISDLRTIFPPTRGTHVFGPMVRLGWGTPTLVTADLGVIVEIPSTKIAILGRLGAALPDEKAPLIVLNMDVLGVIDPAGQRISIDASLYDSRVGPWALSGDMALRSNWGNNPRFVLSAGGFNPRYDPPGDFPELGRIRATLGAPGGNPSLEYEGYFAVTSNTAQLGAGVSLRASAGPASVRGKLEFDALFQFDPFKFVVDFLASLGVKIKGKGLSVRVDGTLSGPSPWRVDGKIHIDLWLITVSARIEATFGSKSDREGLPPANILPKLVDALEQPGNWSAQTPAGAGSIVTVREVESDGAVLVHPLGGLSVRQTIVPLSYHVETFGNARPEPYTEFTIENATMVGGDASASGGDDDIDLVAVVEEHFAPAQYAALTDEEKLDSPAFESLPAGWTLSPSEVYRGGDDPATRTKNAREATLGYRTVVEDRRRGQWGTLLSEIAPVADRIEAPLGVVEAFDDVGAVATGPARTTGRERFRPEKHRRTTKTATASSATGDVGTDPTSADSSARGTLAGAIGMRDSRYVVVEAADMTPATLPFEDADGPIGPTTKSAAKRALSRHVSANPADEGRYQVVEARKARGLETTTTEATQ